MAATAAAAPKPTDLLDSKITKTPRHRHPRLRCSANHWRHLRRMTPSAGPVAGSPGLGTVICTSGSGPLYRARFRVRERISRHRERRGHCHLHAHHGAAHLSDEQREKRHLPGDGNAASHGEEPCREVQPLGQCSDLELQEATGQRHQVHSRLDECVSCAGSRAPLRNWLPRPRSLGPMLSDSGVAGTMAANRSGLQVLPFGT
jgi:hypothetical protein